MDNLQKQFQQDGKTNTYTGLAKAAAWVIMIGTFATMILYLLFMGCSLKGKCHNFSTFFQALLAIFKMFFALIMNLVALVSIIVAIILVNVCYASEKAMNDPDYISLASDDLQKMMTTCIQKTGDGKISNFVDSSTLLDNMIEMTKSFTKDFTKYNPRHGATDNPLTVAFKAYKTDFEKLKNYETSNFPNDSANDPIEVSNTINGRPNPTGIICVLDKVAPHADRCPSGYNDAGAGQISSNTSTQDERAGTADPGDRFCLDLSTWQHAFTGATSRYRTGGPGACANSQETDVRNLRTCVTTHNTALTDFETAVFTTPTGPNQEGYDFYEAMDGIKINFDRINTRLTDISALLQDTNKGIDDFLNCKIFRSEMRNTFGNTCVNFGKNFARQAIILAIIGPLFWLLACCVCCSFRQSKAV
jgi:hypothetical protein